MTILGIVLALNGPNLLLWFIFRNAAGANAAEFACQCQRSSTGGISGLCITFLIALMLRSNEWRRKNREIFADNISAHLVATSATFVTRLAVLPCFRGMWVPPLINKLQTNAGSSSAIEIYCCDCYESKNNSETNDWMRINMCLESTQHLELYSKLDYDSLPFRDSSLDYLVMPTGNLNINFTSIEDEELQKQAYSRFFNEINRVLRPGGKLFATVTTAMFKNPWFDTSVTGEHFEVLPAPSMWIWNTFVPSTIAILQKKGQASIATAAVTEVDGVDESRSAWLPSVSFIRLSEDKVSTLVAKKKLPTAGKMGKQWWWTYGLTALMLVLWVVAVTLTWAFLEQLEVRHMLFWVRHQS